MLNMGVQNKALICAHSFMCIYIYIYIYIYIKTANMLVICILISNNLIVRTGPYQVVCHQSLSVNSENWSYE